MLSMQLETRRSGSFTNSQATASKLGRVFHIYRVPKKFKDYPVALVEEYWGLAYEF